MYQIDKELKKITREYDNLIYTRQMRSPRDVIKYRILAARCLIALNEQEGFPIFHLVPSDQHEMAMRYKAALNGKVFSDVNFYKLYFSDLFKRLYLYYPELKTFDNLVTNYSRSFVKLYAEFDKFVKFKLGKEPLYIGMAISLELRISQHLGKFFSLESIQEIFNDPIFNFIPPDEHPESSKENDSVINTSLDQQPLPIHYEIDLNSFCNSICQNQSQQQLITSQLTTWIKNLDYRLTNLERKERAKKNNQ